MTQLVLQLLGGFRVQDAAGSEIRITSRKGRALLAYLAMRAGDTQSRDRLATLLWEEADEELARTSLRQALAALRKSLPDSVHPALFTDSNALGLDPALIDSDIAALRRSLNAGTRTALQEALAHYRGDLLEGFDARSTAFDEWLSQERLALRRQVTDALHQLTSLCSANDDVEGALGACTRLVSLEPLNEAAHRTIMELQARRNAYADALRQYQICRDILRRELDVAPEPATENLYRDLMRRRRAATSAHAGNDAAVTDEAPVAPVVEKPPEQRAQLRDVVVLVVRLEGLLELERTLDPEEFHALGGEFHQCVQRVVSQFGGQTDRRVGANVLAVFGVPDAHGNEAERAVRAALALQDCVTTGSWRLRTDLHLRTGLSQGQILHDRELFPLTGRPTHVAHTLAAGAPDEGILLSDELRHSLGDHISVQHFTAASSTESPAAWALLSLRSEGAPDQQPFVGRRPELAMILAALDRCRSSRHGRAIVVRGEAGIGKTRLVNAVRAAARESGVEVHSSSVFDFGQSLGRRPITTLALSLLDVSADAPPDHRSQAVARIATATQAGIDQIIFLSDLIDAPLNEELAALEQAMETATRQRGRSLALAQLIESAAQRKPLLLVIEDVHWADQDELARFGEVAAVVAHCPILFLMTTRPEGDPIGATWRARARGCPVTTVDLAPLADDEAQELAAHYPQLSHDVADACIARAEGNPLFLDQLLRAATAGHGSLPGSVRTLVLARADRLSALDRNALQAGAVLGHRFSLAALRQMVDDEQYDPASLMDATLVRTEGTELEFAHALFRDAIYESTLRSRRRELHRRAADWLAAHDLALRADHLAAADDESAPGAYIAAARAEQAALRFERALTIANKANACARDPSQLHQANCLMGELLLVLGRTHDALTAYRESADFAPDQSGQVEAWFGIASALRVMDRHLEALDALERAEIALGESNDARIKARICTLRGNLCFPLGRLEACLQSHEQALHYAAEARSPLDLARAYGGLGDAWYQRGRMKTARDYFSRCIHEGQRHGLPGMRLANLPMVAVTQMYCGEIAAATDSLQQALDLARHAGDVRSELLVQLITSILMLIRGRSEESERHSRLSCALAQQLGARRFHAESLGLMAYSLIVRGERAPATQLLTDALELGRATGMNYCGPSLLSLFARATVDPVERRKALAEGEALLASGCVSHSYFDFYGNAIEVSLQEQQWADARRYADALAAYTQEEPLPWTELLIKRGIVLANVGAGMITAETARSLEQLRATCLTTDLRMPLPSIEAALAKIVAVQA